MAVYTDKQPVEKIQMADNFVNFIISQQTMTDIGNFGTDKYGKALFTPMTKGVPSGVTADFTTPAVAVKPLKVYHAGSLASSFAKIKKTYEASHPDTEVQLWSGGSGAIIDKVTKQNQYADVLASADTVLIPKNMYPKNATFDVNFARNSMVLCYTDKSRGSATINADNWYKVLAQNGVSYAISDPTSDPAGYRSLMTIALAERKYGDSVDLCNARRTLQQDNHENGRRYQNHRCHEPVTGWQETRHYKDRPGDCSVVESRDR